MGLIDWPSPQPPQMCVECWMLMRILDCCVFVLTLTSLSVSANSNKELLYVWKPPGKWEVGVEEDSMQNPDLDLDSAPKSQIHTQTQTTKSMLLAAPLHKKESPAFTYTPLMAVLLLCFVLCIPSLENRAKFLPTLSPILFKVMSSKVQH